MESIKRTVHSNASVDELDTAFLLDGGKGLVGGKLDHELVLGSPMLEEPFVEAFGILGQSLDRDAGEVQTDNLGSLALSNHRPEGELLGSEMALVDSLVAHGERNNGIDRGLETLNTGVKAGGKREQDFLIIGLSTFLGTISRPGTSTRSGIGTFGEDEHPHSTLDAVEGADTVLEHLEVISGFVSFDKDEVVELHSLSNNPKFAESGLEDDEDDVMALVDESNPPDVQPVGVDLVVSDKDGALREGSDELSIHKLEGTCQALIITDLNVGWAPNLSDDGEKDTKHTFEVCLISIIPFLVNGLEDQTCVLTDPNGDKNDQNHDS